MHIQLSLPLHMYLYYLLFAARWYASAAYAIMRFVCVSVRLSVTFVRRVGTPF